MSPQAEKKLERIQDLLRRRDEINAELESLLEGDPIEGRPAKEPKTKTKSKRGGAHPCKICQTPGHNSRTCPKKAEETPEAAPPRRRGRPPKSAYRQIEDDLKDPEENDPDEEEAEKEESDDEEGGGGGKKLTLKQFNSVKEGQKRGMKDHELAELMKVSVFEVGDAMEKDTYREYISVRY